MIDHATAIDDNAVADEVNDVVDEHPWLERVMQVGWIAKGIVYSVMGITAIEISRHGSPSGNASPDGSITRIAAAPFGRASLVVAAAGLTLYCLWRLLSVAVIRGTGMSQWADRAGYTFSAVFYGVLAWTAGSAAYQGGEPSDSSTVETLSRSVLDATLGRWLVGAAGVATIAVGIYFGIHKGVQRSFAADLANVNGDVRQNGTKRSALVIAGIVGWVGRGVVTALVGFFVLRSAVQFDPSDARGFDRSLRTVAAMPIGSVLVLVCGVGLIAYGAFCFASRDYRVLADTS